DLDRRIALIDAAERFGAIVIEDDYDSEFHYRGQPIPALSGLERAGRVIYLGTFSKSMLPALRTAYVIVPDPLVRPVKTALRNIGAVPALTMQAALADFIAEGHLRAHVRRQRQVYGARRDHLVAMIDEKCPRLIVDPVPDGGIQLVARLADGDRADVDLCREVQARGIEALPLSRYYIGAEPQNGLRLGFALPDLDEIERGVAVLAEVCG
ncbi:MAG: PLP-dependent aminotransferase family protein, partial [Hyphomicrobiales bacterium]|nr:PLP-dependent aminotransferase family protein [Hyphomicrobiales bacterium]